MRGRQAKKLRKLVAKEAVNLRRSLNKLPFRARFYLAVKLLLGIF